MHLSIIGFEIILQNQISTHLGVSRTFDKIPILHASNVHIIPTTSVIQYLHYTEYILLFEYSASLKYWNYSVPKMRKCLVFTMSDLLSLVVAY